MDNKTLKQLEKEEKELQAKMELTKKMIVTKKGFVPGAIITGGWIGGRSGDKEVTENGKYRRIKECKIEDGYIHWSQHGDGGLVHRWELKNVKVVTGKELEEVENNSIKKELKLNKVYTALVNHKGVQVGCQMFSHDIINKLYALSKEFQKK
jgi:hypothetical protein